VPEHRVVIADDEPLARSSLRRLLGAHPEIAVVAECRDGREAVRAIAELGPDLVFLDIEMPELDGFGVIREVGPARMPAVVFVTAHREFAVRAFEVHALDYLVKPFSDERFEVALDRALRRLGEAHALDWARRLAALVGDAPPSPAPAREFTNRFLITVGNRAVVVTASDVDWIEASDYYAALHVGAKRHLVRESLNQLEATLDPRQFLRVHRSAIVKIERVRELERGPDGTLTVVLQGGTRIPVSRSRREHVEVTLGRAPGS
jgi:two-component system LytT family response regulator